MPYSYVQYTGTGTAPLLSVPFPYLLKAHVRLYTGYDLLTDTWTAELIDGVGFTWTSATQVQLSSNLANGVVLTIIRKTPTNARLVDWNDASNLLAGDMDTADLQTLYAVQEQQDRVTQAAAIADAANDAVADVLLYAPIANVALIPGSPANGDRIELADSTGIESFSPLSGRPVGFVGSNQLRVRMYWNAATSSWVWVSYYTADPDGRYVRQSSISDSVSSTSQATVASSLAVKTAKDAADATVTTAKLGDGAVTTPKLGAGAVTAAKLGSGLILKVQHFSDAGSSTSSTALVNANGLYFNYTPVSSNSKLLLIASFQAQITYLANTTTYGYHSLGESGTAIGSTYVSGANSVAGIGAYTMGTIQADLNNASTATRAFGIMHRTSNASAAVYSNFIRCTILEIAN